MPRISNGTATSICHVTATVACQAVTTVPPHQRACKSIQEASSSVLLCSVTSLLMWLSAVGMLASTTQAQDVPDRDSRPITICTTPFPPMVDCDPIGNPDDFTGHDIEQMRILAERLGWTSPANYTFKCFDAFVDILHDLQGVSGKRECALAASGVTRSTERQNMGLHFTYPTYRSSLGILVQAEIREGSHWGFLRPLHWSVWLATTITTLIVPWLVFVIEGLACHGFVHRGDWMLGAKNATWDSASALVNFGSFQVRSTEARIVVMGYGFLVLIIINTYVANLAAFLTVTQVDISISDVEDLLGEEVVSVEPYKAQLKRLGINPIIVKQDDSFLRDFVEGVRSARWKAAIIDEPWVSNVASNGSNCDLKILPKTIVPFDYAFAFPTDARQEFIQQLSTEVLAMQEEGISSQLAERFIQFPNSGCPEDNEISETRSVKFYQVLGLWIILGVCICLAFMLLIGNRYRNVPAALVKARNVEKDKWREGLSLGPRNKVTTEYHSKASAQLKHRIFQHCQCEELARQVAEMREAIKELAAEVRRDGCSCNGGRPMWGMGHRVCFTQNDGSSLHAEALPQQIDEVVASVEDSAKSAERCTGPMV